MNEYGEFEMLSTEIVKMVEAFDGWEEPENERLTYKGWAKDDPYLTEEMKDSYYSEIWESWDLYNYYDEPYFPRLNLEELEALKAVLMHDTDNKRRYRNFLVLSHLVRWFLDKSAWSSEVEDEDCYLCNEDYYIRGEGPYSGLSPQDLSNDPFFMDKLSFFGEYFQREMFKNMGPVWLERLRNIIKEGAGQIPSEPELEAQTH